MTVEFRMPSLGPDMESGTLVEWRMAPGDQVHRGAVVALVETEKGIIDVEIFNDGVVERLWVDMGAHVPVGSVLATLSGTAAAPETAAPVHTPSPQPVIEARQSPAHAATNQVPSRRPSVLTFAFFLARLRGPLENAALRSMGRYQAAALRVNASLEISRA